MEVPLASCLRCHASLITSKPPCNHHISHAPPDSHSSQPKGATCPSLHRRKPPCPPSLASTKQHLLHCLVTPPTPQINHAVAPLKLLHLNHAPSPLFTPLIIQTTPHSTILHTPTSTCHYIGCLEPIPSRTKRTTFSSNKLLNHYLHIYSPLTIMYLHIRRHHHLSLLSQSPSATNASPVHHLHCYSVNV